MFFCRFQHRPHQRRHAGDVQRRISGGFVVFATTVTAFGVRPLEGFVLLFGVYRFMSMVMAIATCNTIGNSVATVVVSKWSGEFTEQTAKAEYSRVFGRNPEAAL